MEQTVNYEFFVIGLIVLVIVGTFLGAGENRKIIVFNDYDDLGLSFLVSASYFIIYYLFLFIGLNPIYGMYLGLTVSCILLFFLIYRTFNINNRNFLKTFLALITKLPLATIWLLSLLAVLDPSGKKASKRRQNRAIGLVLLTLLTPVIGFVVVNKDGSRFNPASWIRGRRVGSRIRSHL